MRFTVADRQVSPFLSQPLSLSLSLLLLSVQTMEASAATTRAFQEGEPTLPHTNRARHAEKGR